MLRSPNTKYVLAEFRLKFLQIRLNPPLPFLSPERGGCAPVNPWCAPVNPWCAPVNPWCAPNLIV